MIVFKECYPILTAELSVILLFVLLFYKRNKKIYLFVIGLVFCALLITFWFFRDPIRQPTGNSSDIVSPADGKIVNIEKNVNLPFSKEKYTRVSIYLSLFNVHINRIPIGGKIFFKKHEAGKFHPAFSKQASNYNENMLLGIKTKYGQIYVKQISGYLARRIVCNVAMGDSVSSGVKYGMIKFGSRVELYIPGFPDIIPRKGSNVWAGESVICSYE